LDDDLPEPVPAVELPPVWASPKRGIIFMDKFTPYFGYYMSQRAREAYGVACINVMSSYMIGYSKRTRRLDGTPKYGHAVTGTSKRVESADTGR
jgi:hypothetical protein